MRKIRTEESCFDCCVWLSVCICQPVCACLYCLPYIGRPLTLPSAIMCMAVCSVLWGGGGGGGCISPRAGLIGVKQASVKSHQRLEMLSETGNLLLGGLPPNAGLCVSLSVLLSLPISLPLKISHHSSVSICSLPLPLTLSWLQTLSIYHSFSHP